MRRLAAWLAACALLLTGAPAEARTREQYGKPLNISTIRIRSDAFGSGLFGARRKGGRPHRGVDLIAPVGTRVLAVKSGVARIGRKRNGMGRYVEVFHADGSKSRYGHLGSILVRDRQRVRKGHALGTVGRTGNARSKIIQPHLHFELWNRKGAPVNPWPHIAKTENS